MPEDGAYADLYKATDDLERTVAVKIVGPSVGNTTFVIDQAKALARAQHKNVVTVYSVEEEYTCQENLSSLQP